MYVHVCVCMSDGIEVSGQAGMEGRKDSWDGKTYLLLYLVQAFAGD